MKKHVLDLDLDFFLDDIAYNRKGRRRLSSRLFQPWQPNEVRFFLEIKCGLSQQRRLPGKLVETHDEAYPIFHELGSGNRIAVTHVDAHSDLSFGGLAWSFIIEKLLKDPIGQRNPPCRGRAKLDQGNYLAYALACGLISELTYVHHQLRTEDLVRYFFHNQDPATNIIEIPWVPIGLRHAISDFSSDIWGKARRYDPQIPFTLISEASYLASSTFDFAVLCRSPAYTPKSADALLSVFEEYIDFS